MTTPPSNNNDFVVNFSFDFNDRQLDTIQRAIQNVVNGIERDVRRSMNAINRLQDSVYNRIERRSENLARRLGRRQGGRGGGGGGGGQQPPVQPPAAAPIANRFNVLAASITAMTYAVTRFMDALNEANEDFRRKTFVAQTAGASPEQAFGLRMGLTSLGYSGNAIDSLLEYGKKLTNFPKFGGNIPEGFEALQRIGLGMEDFKDKDFKGNIITLLRGMATINDPQERMAMARRLGLDERMMRDLSPGGVGTIEQYSAGGNIDLAEERANELTKSVGKVSAAWQEFSAAASIILKPAFSGLLNVLAVALKTLADIINGFINTANKISGFLSKFGLGSLGNILESGSNNAKALPSASSSKEAPVINVTNNFGDTGGTNADEIADQVLETITQYTNSEYMSLDRFLRVEGQ